MEVNGVSAKDLFYLDPNIVHFNHGSFGGCPKAVLEAKARYERQSESSTDRWYRSQYTPLMQKNLEHLAHHFHCDVDGLAFTDNVTFAVYSIIKSFPFKKGDAILVHQQTYGTVRWMAELEKDVGVVTLDLKFPVTSDDEVINKYRETVQTHPEIRLAIVDHIVSGTAMLMPVKEITRTLKEMGITVLVDGAHAPGQILNLNIDDIDGDFYVGNLHKWFYAPRPLGILWANRKYRDFVKPSIISWKYHETSIAERFSFLGSRDVANTCTMPDIEKFYESLGGMGEVYNYITHLKASGQALILDKWNTTLLPVPNFSPFMFTVKLPDGFTKHNETLKKLVENMFQADWYAFALDNFKVQIPLLRLNNAFYVRFSVQIYHTLADFENVAEAFLVGLGKMGNE